MYINIMGIKYHKFAGERLFVVCVDLTYDLLSSFMDVGPALVRVLMTSWPGV